MGDLRRSALPVERPERQGEQQTQQDRPVEQHGQDVVLVLDQPEMERRGEEDRVQRDAKDRQVEEEWQSLQIRELTGRDDVADLVVLEDDREQESRAGAEHPERRDPEAL